MRIIILLFIAFIFYFQGNAQSTIRGFVYDKSSGEPIMFANVLIKGTKIGTSTDVNGFFSFTKLQPGTYTLKVQFIGYDTATITVTVKDKEVITRKIYLIESSVLLQEVDVSAERTDKVEQVRISVNKITPKQIERIPSMGSEPDFAQYVQVLPGVIFTGDQGGQLYIRGGAPIQNKVLLDGMVVYNPFHSIGFFSVFDSDIIRSADVYTGGFNAEYGGRISSVMDIITKDGNRNRQSGKISASTFGSKLLLEGPILKGEDLSKTSLSYVFSAKTSYIRESSKILYSYVDSSGIPFSFNDFYGKLSLNTENGSKVNVFGFRFTDDVKYKALSRFNWKSGGVGSNIILVPAGSPFLFKTNFSYSKYEITLKESDDLPRNSEINGFNLGLSFNYFMGKNELNYGIETFGFKTDFNYYNAVGRLIDQVQNTTELAAFIKYKIAKEKIILEPGFRVQYYASLTKISLEPRFGAKYIATDKLRFKLATGIYSQNFISANSDRDVVNLFYGFLSSPEVSDLPEQFDGKEVKTSIQKAMHIVTGFEYDVNKNIDINIEGYFKRFIQLANINRNKIFDDTGDNWQVPDLLKKDFVIETGNAYGADVTLKYEYKRNYFWMAYSLGYVDRYDGFITYNPIYDRRHNINIVATRTLGKNLDWELSARWNFGSGFPFSKTAGYYEQIPMNDINIDLASANALLGILYGQLNAGRLPSYHRLDITLKKTIEFSKNSTMEINFACTNVYNRANIFYYDRIRSKRVNQLPIIPSIGMNLTF
ncbi:MAG: TonB-dependent receptor [Bacteroidales bacterium]|nr:TonB-dependent receptor [Bacteroidales bacterium]